MPGTTATPDAASHADLLDAAHRIRAIARSGDADDLVAALIDLRDDMVDHVDREADEIGRLPGATPAVARNGQEQLIDLVDRIVADAGHHDDVDRVLAACELELRLLRQVRLETTLRLHTLA